MNGMNSVSDPRFAYQWAWCLNQMFSGNNLAAVNNSMLAIIGEQTTAQSYPMADLAPPMVIIKGPTVAVVLVQGIRTAAQVGALVLSWIEDRTRREYTGFVRVADRVSDTIYGRMQAFGCLDCNRIILAGHSYGGMCLMSLASRLANENVNRIVSLATFGSPKGGDDRLAVSMQRVDYGRYMNVGDNITFCPPDGDQGPMMHLMLSRGESQNVNQLVLVGQGQVITDAGVITTAGYPPLPGVFTDLSIANFLVSNEAPVAISHAIPEYVRRLGLWVDANPPQQVRGRAAGTAIGNQEPVQVSPTPPVDVWLPGMPVGSRSGGNIPINKLPTRDALHDAAVVPDAEYPDLNPSLASVAGAGPVTAYKTRKVGKIWVCYYIDPQRICMFGTSKTQAKLFARRMNSALNTWDRAAATDEGAFEQSAIDAFN